MKLSFGERQPYRIWFDYLKTCLNDESLSKKIDRVFYKDWNLTSVKTQKFDTWYKTHEHLFTDTSTTMKISNGTKSSNSILLEIPVNYSITKVQREVGKVLENKLNKRLSKFSITSNRALILPPLDYFLYAWKLRYSNKDIKLAELWTKVQEHIQKRQGKVSKLVKNKKLRSRALQSGDSNERKAILISRNINKAQKILENVCKGIFTGNYADN
tara:strand:+ start:1039 stop:1680 length:642 start_codon:yes stop_codon:yes gene_type:complete